MIEDEIFDYFSKNPFNNEKYPIFMSDCEDEGCKLNGNFNHYIILNGDHIVKCLKNNEKSADRIIFTKRAPNNKVDVLLCELTTGSKRYFDVEDKIIHSGEYILGVLEKLGFTVRNFDCIFLGEYKNSNRLNKSRTFSIPGFWRNDLKIQDFSCGHNISDIPNLNIRVY